LARESHLFQNILEAAGLKAEDVDNLVWWFEKAKEKARENQAFWEPKNLAKKGALGRGLSSGFTPLLDQFGLDWALILSQKQFEEIVGHQSEIEQIERILVKSQFANCLIVGDPGSGRGAVLQALTQKILFGESLAELNYQRVMELDLPRLTASLKTLPEIDNALQIIFQEAVSAGNVVLVVQDLHNFVGLAGSLSNFLKYPGLKLVAVTDYHGLHRQIEPSQLMNFFEKVEVEPLSAPETTRLLEWLVPSYETKYKKFISYLALKELVNKSEKYLPALPFPKKAVDLLEELMIFVSKNQETTVLASHVDQLISQKTQIPVGQIDFKEREILLNLEALLHERIINQEEAVREAASALRRARSGVATKKGTIGNFLFLGPTGVGKTETAKALAQIYFGSEDKIIRLDLSEYQNPEDLRRLLGSAQEESYFVTAVRENPFSLVLLDEIEKAHSQVHNLFLQILDEGAMRDGLGRKINFNHCLLIATSNAGYQVILEAIEQKQEMPAIKDKLIKYVFDQGIFRPEFLNRFDALVVFRSLTKENLLAIAELLLSKLKKNLKDKNVELVITPELKEKIVELGYDPIFGARQMKRVIQDRVENIIASALLAGQIKRGDKIEIEVPDFKLIVA
jgi:ATP-dependent Clp protease ATP-binding subunit ClpC